VPAPLPDGVRAERDGPIVRIIGWPRGGFVDYRNLGGLEGADLDELIMRQVRVFAERGESFEWKTHGYDRPADLPDRLCAAGFIAEPQETVLVARVGTIARECDPPRGVALREMVEEADFRRVALLEDQVWGTRHAAGLAPTLAARRALDPRSISVFAAEAAGEVICAAWVRFELGSTIAKLHGGATLPEWRGHGVYRAIVAERARLAAQRGCDYLQVDASDASRPILERLGFTAIATTTPFRWCPPG
jgi:GNAT superfamily N-acetyltransferase